MPVHWQRENLPQIAIADGVYDVDRVILDADDANARAHPIDRPIWPQMLRQLYELKFLLKHPKKRCLSSVDISSNYEAIRKLSRAFPATGISLYRSKQSCFRLAAVCIRAWQPSRVSKQVT
jgi:hypothetical protein